MHCSSYCFESACVLLLFFVVDFSVMVLSSVAWPFTQGPPFTVPGEVIIYVGGVSPHTLEGM